jgi:hypothetical protein
LLAIGSLAVLTAFVMPETRPRRDADDDAAGGGAGGDHPARDKHDVATEEPAASNANPKPPARLRA